MEDRGVEAVEGDGDPAQAGAGQSLRMARQQAAVRREGEVEARAEGCELRDQVLEAVAQERLPARDPDLLDPEADEQPDQPLDLLEGQDLIAGRKAYFSPKISAGMQ
jgi:hypothetical protein